MLLWSAGSLDKANVNSSGISSASGGVTGILMPDFSISMAKNSLCDDVPVFYNFSTFVKRIILPCWAFSPCFSNTP